MPGDRSASQRPYLLELDLAVLAAVTDELVAALLLFDISAASAAVS